MLPPDVERGARLFDAGEYFAAHEAWEDHWGRGPPEERALTLALIKAAVALHHLRGENASGFLWQAERAIEPLRRHATVWPDLAADALADAVESLASQARFHGALPAGWSVPPLLRSSPQRRDNNG